MNAREASSLRELLLIRFNNRAAIDHINGNLGSALGYKYVNGVRTNSPAVIIFVPKKLPAAAVPATQLPPARLEASINGVTIWASTDIIEGGKSGEYVPGPAISDENKHIVAQLASGTLGLVGGIRLAAYDEYNKGYTGTAAVAVRETATGVRSICSFFLKASRSNRHI